MSVPSQDTLCRFVRRQDWSRREGRPKPGAFKQSGLSVWNCDKLREHGVTLDELRIEHLSGCGQAHHTAGDYLEHAREAERQDGIVLGVQVLWRSGDEHVAPPWRNWRCAHVQIESTSGLDRFTPYIANYSPGGVAIGCRLIPSADPDNSSASPPTSQPWTEDAEQTVCELTAGQPWLVNTPWPPKPATGTRPDSIAAAR